MERGSVWQVCSKSASWVCGESGLDNKLRVGRTAFVRNSRVPNRRSSGKVGVVERGLFPAQSSRDRSRRCAEFCRESLAVLSCNSLGESHCDTGLLG